MDFIKGYRPPYTFEEFGDLELRRSMSKFGGYEVAYGNMVGWYETREAAEEKYNHMVEILDLYSDKLFEDHQKYWEK